MIDLRLGDWREVCHDVECDTFISDPPYSSRTHEGHDSREQYDEAERRDLSYTSFTPDDVNSFVDFWHPRTRGWMAIMSCSDLSPVYRAAFERVGRCSFAPCPIVIRGMTVRMAGDGPSSWAVYLNVARPRTEEFSRWGTLPGAYPTTRKTKGYIGGKPISTMTAIVGDYSRGQQRAYQDQTLANQSYDMQQAQSDQWRQQALQDIETQKANDIAWTAQNITELRELLGGL